MKKEQCQQQAEKRAEPIAGENPKQAIKANKLVSNIHHGGGSSRDGSGEKVMQQAEKNEDSATPY